MLPAAKVGDVYISSVIPPIPGLILGPGSAKVKIEGRPVALMGDLALHGLAGLDVIILGSPKVLIEGRPVARLFDLTIRGGIVFLSSVKILIG